MKKLLLLLTIIISAFSLSAQDIHFSQFYLSPLNLNPALTGVMNCNVRLTANYRNQWASVSRGGVYNTYNASYDQRFTSGRYDYWGLGATLWADVAGSANFGTTTFKISGSYAKRMAGNRKESHYLSFGAEAGVSQRSIQFDKLKWGLQYTGTEYDPNLSTGEFTLDQPNLLFADASAGLLWFSNFANDANLYVGGVYHHLTRADQSFSTTSNDALYSRITVHAGGELPVTDRFGLVPGVIVMSQGPSLEINTGASAKFKIGNSRYNKQAFHLGVWTRLANRVDQGILTDAVILQTRFDYNEYTLGFSYDLNVSPLRPGSYGQGGFELALQYQFCGRENRGVYCPNF